MSEEKTSGGAPPSKRGLLIWLGLTALTVGGGFVVASLIGADDPNAGIAAASAMNPFAGSAACGFLGALIATFGFATRPRVRRILPFVLAGIGGLVGVASAAHFFLVIWPNL